MNENNTQSPPSSARLTTAPRRKKSRRPRLRGFVGALVLLAVAGLGIFWLLGGFVDNNDPAVVVEQAGKLIILPDEDPTVTTVESARELSREAFFADVENGDKILIFPSSARIIIYRPSDNILVNVGPIVDDVNVNSLPGASADDALIPGE